MNLRYVIPALAVVAMLSFVSAAQTFAATTTLGQYRCGEDTVGAADGSAIGATLDASIGNDLPKVLTSGTSFYSSNVAVGSGSTLSCLVTPDYSYELNPSLYGADTGLSPRRARTGAWKPGCMRTRRPRDNSWQSTTGRPSLGFEMENGWPI